MRMSLAVLAPTIFTLSSKNGSFFKSFGKTEEQSLCVRVFQFFIAGGDSKDPVSLSVSPKPVCPAPTKRAHKVFNSYLLAIFAHFAKS